MLWSLTYYLYKKKSAFTKILSSTTVFNIADNNNRFLSSKSVRMISEGSCDTEDWGNDAENSSQE